ncbi:hypothetical protein BGW42_005733 [Actinomortierella wolfii]|nr:hypothetical protein BGW42_005733 [Actinomortierella wolfii]
MQLKSLLVSAVAVAAVSAQSFEKGPCSDCIFKSFNKNAVCTKLPASDMTSLSGAFANYTVNVPLLSSLIQKQAIKGCVCDWVSTAFTTNGAASSCTTGTSPACNATQVKTATEQLGRLNAGILKCSNATTPSSSPTPTKAPSPKPSSGASAINLPYAISFAFIGVVTFLGL